MLAFLSVMTTESSRPAIGPEPQTSPSSLLSKNLLLKWERKGGYAL